MDAKRYLKIVLVLLVLAAVGVLALGLCADASMRTASRHRIIGILDGEALIVEVIVARGKATIVNMSPYIE